MMNKRPRLRHQAELWRALLLGRHLDRHAIAKIFGVQLPAAGKQLRALILARLPGLVVERCGNSHWIYLDLKRLTKKKGKKR